MLGTTLLFWGAMCDRALLGLMLALVVEASHWTRFRWEFEEDACRRAWQLTSAIIIVAGTLIWLDGNHYTALPVLLSWMPPLLLPMQFIQSYGMKDSVPLSAFSFLARRHQQRNLRLGLARETLFFNFGNVTFLTALVASSVGYKADTWMYLPGMVLLVGWGLLSTIRPSFALIPLLVTAGLLALAGQIGLDRAGEWIGGRSGNFTRRFNPDFHSTMIGSRGTIQQSPDIIWRLRPSEKSAPPLLLRIASFATFTGSEWQTQRVADVDFKDLNTRLIGDLPCHLLQETLQSDTLTQLPSFSMRGAASEASPLPLPGDAAGLRDFELDGIERNTFGTVRVFPKQFIIDGTVFWKGGTNPERPPLPDEDLAIPVREREVIRKAAADLHLDREPDLRLKLATLSTWFLKDFRYTRDLTIQRPLGNERFNRATNISPLTRFLTDVRAGHCEYFATAATLILREAGIPARYAMGFAVMERDAKRGEFVIRGTHGHAWCRVWDQAAGTWLDFDATPPDWTAALSQKPTWTQVLSDAMTRLREDFFVWRSRPVNRLAVTLAMTSIGLALAAFIAKRLWRSKRRLETISRSDTFEGPIIRTPLHELEAQARKHLGPRPPGQPFARWLARLRPSLPDPEALDEAIGIHQQLRFDPQPPPPARRERLAALARQFQAALKRK